MTLEDIDKLIELGKDACNYFEHVIIALGYKTGHDSRGCIFCKKGGK